MAYHRRIDRQYFDRAGVIELGPYHPRERAFGDLEHAVGERRDLTGTQPGAALAEMRLFARGVDFAFSHFHAAGTAGAAAAASTDDAYAAAPRGLIDRLPRLAVQRPLDLREAKRDGLCCPFAVGHGATQAIAGTAARPDMRHFAN